MSVNAKLVALTDRTLIRLMGPDWRPFLQGLITQNSETLAVGQVAYGALLTPQGRLLHDLFIWGLEDGAMLDVAAETRDALMARLSMYKLRSKVTLAAEPGCVFALFDAAEEPDPAAGWRADPRAPGLGWRAYGEAPPAADAAPADLSDYDAHRIRLGAPDLVRDQLSDKAYAVEANLDLLHGIDFAKGCFVGQETTSRMKRRGPVKTRLIPLSFDGPAPPAGTEVLAGTLRAGEVLSSGDGCALALIRLDRALDQALTVEDRPVRLDPPAWLSEALTPA